MIPMKPATMDAAAEAYRHQVRFHAVVQMIVSEEMHLARRALDEAMRDPYNIRETVDYIATSVAARVLQTVYENDAEVKEWKGHTERLLKIVGEHVGLQNPQPIPIPKP